MQERRQFERFPMQMKGRYLEQSNNAWYDFSTVNISRTGMAIELFPKERFNRDLPFQSELILPSIKEPIHITGDVMWTKDVNGNGGSHIIGGIRFSAIDKTSKLGLLDCVFNDLHRQQTKLDVGYQYKFMGILVIVINIVILSFLIYTLLTKYK